MTPFDPALETAFVSFLQEVEGHAIAEDKTLLDDYLKLRDEFLAELPAYKVEIMTRFAKARRCAYGTVDRKLWQIRKYPSSKLREWFAKGFSFDHLENAAVHYEEAGFKDPAEFMDILEDGMTADEMESVFYPPIAPAPSVQTRNMVASLCDGIARLFKWSADKSEAFRRDVEDVVRRHIGS